MEPISAKMTKRILLGAQRMGVSRETLLVTLKVTGAELLDLTYGGRVLTPEQIQKLEQHTGKTMQELADLGTPDSETERAKPATKDTKAATNDTKPATENVTPRPGMKLGVVKWFNDQKGFGFITNAEGKDVFVHHSCIEGEGFQTLQDGEQVEFEEVEGAKGPKAERVRRLVRP